MAAGQDLQVSPSEMIISRTAIIQQKISYSTHKYIQEICTLRYMKVGVMEQAEVAGHGEGERWEPQTQKDWCTTPHWAAQRGRGSNQPEGLLHNEAECRVRGREVVQSMAIVDQLPSSEKQRHRWGNLPLTLSCGSLIITTLTQKISKRQKQHSSLTDLNT